MTQIDQIIADALAGSPETHAAILAREVVRLREAHAVVVPQLVHLKHPPANSVPAPHWGQGGKDFCESGWASLLWSR